MIKIMEEDRDISVIVECISCLSSAVSLIEKAITRPVISDVSGQNQYRFSEHTPYHVAFLKAVRIVSGLNACLFLLKGGFAQEIMLIIRTLDDFTAEIMFVLESADNGTMSKDQNRFLADFFSEEFENANNPLLNKERRNTVPKKTIFASIARQMKPFGNPSDNQKMFIVVNDALSGYIHGAYPHIMEMFDGNPPHFLCEGMASSQRISSCIKQIKIYTQRAIMVFDIIAKNLGLAELSEFLVETRNNFENEIGYTQPKDINKEIEKLKKKR